MRVASIAQRRDFLRGECSECAADRLPKLRLVRGEIVPRSQSAPAPHLGRDLVGRGAKIKRIGSALGDFLQCDGKLRLNEALAGLPRFPICLAVHPMQRGELLSVGFFVDVVQGIRSGCIHREAIPREAYGGHHHLSRRETADAPVR